MLFYCRQHLRFLAPYPYLKIYFGDRPVSKKYKFTMIYVFLQFVFTLIQLSLKDVCMCKGGPKFGRLLKNKADQI